MVNVYIIMILESIHIILMGIILFYKARKLLKEKNLLDLAFLWVLVLTTVLVVYNAYVNIRYTFGFSERVFIGQIELSIVIGILASAPYFWFLLNLVQFKRLFSLPFVLAFFIVIYGYYKPADMLFSVYIATTFIPGSIALIINAIKRKHGLSFSIGISVVMYLFTQAFISPQLFILYYVLQYSLLCVLLLGVTGYWDRKIFFDREYQEKIKNTWISHRIGS